MENEKNYESLAVRTVRLALAKIRQRDDAELVLQPTIVEEIQFVEQHSLLSDFASSVLISTKQWGEKKLIVFGLKKNGEMLSWP